MSQETLKQHFMGSWFLNGYLNCVGSEFLIDLHLSRKQWENVDLFFDLFRFCSIKYYRFALIYSSTWIWFRHDETKWSPAWLFPSSFTTFDSASFSLVIMVTLQLGLLAYAWPDDPPFPISFFWEPVPPLTVVITADKHRIWKWSSTVCFLLHWVRECLKDFLTAAITARHWIRERRDYLLRCQGPRRPPHWHEPLQPALAGTWLLTRTQRP